MEPGTNANTTLVEYLNWCSPIKYERREAGARIGEHYAPGEITYEQADGTICLSLTNDKGRKLYLWIPPQLLADAVAEAVADGRLTLPE